MAISDLFDTSLEPSGQSHNVLRKAQSSSASPDRKLDPRLGPLLVEEVNVGMEAHAAAGGSTSSTSAWNRNRVEPTSPKGAATAASVWRSQFTQSASFTVDEETDSPSEVVFGILHLFKDGERRDGTKEEGAAAALEDDSGTILAVLGLPRQVTAAEFLAWVEPARGSVEKMRMIREVNASRCTVLMKFRDAIDAEEFYKQYAGQPVPYFEGSGGGGGRGGDGAATAPTKTPVSAPTSSPSPPTSPLAHIVYVTQVTVSTSSRLPYAYPQLANSDPWPLPRESDAGGVAAADADPAARLALSLAQELPTCPVCLERMDSNLTGLMTVSCQHTFHCDCLSRWGDARCPVCRYSQNRTNGVGARRIGGSVGTGAAAAEEEGASHCALCSTTDDLWVCLICASVGCGRYKRGCAKQHFVESGHIYSLEVETSRVWDYVHDGYVHRLIQNRADGKLVELPQSTRGGGGSSSRERRRQRRERRAARRRRRRQQGEQGQEQGTSSRAGDDADADGYLSSSTSSSSSSSSGLDAHDVAKSDGKLGTSDEKLEAISLEYQYLLLSQLESQRAYYEEQVRRLQTELDEVRSSETNRSAAVSREREAQFARDRAELQSELTRAHERESRAASRHEKAMEVAAKLSRDFQAERSLSKGLMERVEQLTRGGEAQKEQMDVMRGELAATREQVSDLMFALSMRDRVEQEGGVGEEMKGGDLVVSGGREGDAPSKKSSSSSNAKKKKKKVAKKPVQTAKGGDAGGGGDGNGDGDGDAGGTTVEEKSRDVGDDAQDA